MSSVQSMAMKICGGVLLLAAAMSAPAEEPLPISTFTTPASALRLVERSDSYKSGSYAVWRGKVQLTGNLVVVFARPPAGESQFEDKGSAFFEPDERSRSKLPQAIGSFYALPMTFIWLDQDGKTLLTRALGKQRAQALASSSDGRFEFPVEITIKAFRTDVECDHRSYSAELVAIKRLRPTLVAAAEGGENGC